MTCSGCHSIGGLEFRPVGEQGTNSWAERPLISCQLDPEMELGGWSAQAALGTVSRNDSGGNVGLWLQACPRITHCQHMLTGCLFAKDHKCIPFSVCFASVTICVLWATKPRYSEAFELCPVNVSGEGLTGETWAS